MHYKRDRVRLAGSAMAGISMSSMSDFDLYRMVLRSHLGRAWMASLPVVDFTNTFDARHLPVTAMTLQVKDQAELIGLLNEVHARGLALLSLVFVGQEGE